MENYTSISIRLKTSQKVNNKGLYVYTYKGDKKETYNPNIAWHIIGTDLTTVMESFNHKEVSKFIIEFNYH